jgi:hypothetical protein
VHPLSWFPPPGQKGARAHQFCGGVRPYSSVFTAVFTTAIFAAMTSSAAFTAMASSAILASVAFLAIVDVATEASLAVEVDLSPSDPPCVVDAAALRSGSSAPVATRAYYPDSGGLLTVDLHYKIPSFSSAEEHRLHPMTPRCRLV